MSWQREAYEAISSALFQTSWEHLGEDLQGNGFWTRDAGVRGAVRVTVQRPLDTSFVRVLVEWPTVALGRVMRGQVTLFVQTSGMFTRGQVVEGTTRVVTRVLEIYRDVLTGSGVAGKAELDKFDFGQHRGS